RHTSFSRDWSSDVCSSDLVPAVVEVCGKLAGQASALALQRDRAPPVAAQLQDVQVGAEEEEVLDELPARPGMAVLREAVHEQKRLAEDRLEEGLGRRLEAGDHQRPAVDGLHLVGLRPVQGARLDLVDGGAARACLEQMAHMGNLGTLATGPQAPRMRSASPTR